MGDYRKIEIVASVIGLEENPMTKEQGNKIISIRKLILINENLTVEEIAHAFSVMITNLEQEY